MELKQSLNGGYQGVYGEVVEYDVYFMRDTDDIVSINDPDEVHVKGHKRKFDFTPSIIFDLGANVGVFTRYCRELFGENVLIVAVEPHPDNFKYLSDLKGRTEVINKAIGRGDVWRSKGSANGSGECYLSKTEGYSKIDENSNYELTGIITVTVKELFDYYARPTDKIIVKMDIEGAENSVLSDEESVKKILTADYFVMEYHNYALTAEEVIEVTKLTNDFMKRFEDTHDCEVIHPIFYATKKRI